jgi:hypothetical protein
MPFEKGNKVNQGRKNPNAGRKVNALKERLNRIMEAACTDQQLTEIFDMAVTRARAGDSDARNFVFDRMFGKPISELDRAIINAISNERGEPVDAET